MSPIRAKTLIFLPITAMLMSSPVTGQQPVQNLSQMTSLTTSSGDPTYADLVDLAEAAPLVIRATVREQVTLKPDRSPGLEPGFARLYIEARTVALISGNVPIGETLKYLVDVPLNTKGKPPKLKKQDVMLFARTVPGRPSEIQLVDAGAQFLWSDQFEQRLRPVLAATLSADKPPVVTGIVDALSVAGNLVGESETQLFLSTLSDAPASITVLRRPGQSPSWGVSWTEIVDQAAEPIRPGTLPWYRLACFLPKTLPINANLSQDDNARTRAAQDYRFVVEQLGPCPRNRTMPTVTRVSVKT